MLNTLFRAIFPKAPPSIPHPVDTLVKTQAAVISALVSHIEADGGTITQVRVPSFVLGGADYIAFRGIKAVPGLDPFGANVEIEHNPKNSNSASATATATTVTDSAEAK